jgi:hypothetical protein
MLEITANQQPVTLAPDTSISMKLLSPVFNELGNHSLDFESPAEGNEQVFDYPHRINKKSLPVKNLPMRLTHGSFAMEGLLSIMSATGHTYRHFIKTGIGVLAETLKNTKLSELHFDTFQLGTINSEVTASLNEIISSDFPVEGCNFPVIHDAVFYGETDQSLNPEYEGFINNYESGSIIGNVILAGYPTNVNTICPQPFAWHILDKIFEFVGYKHDNPLLRTESLRRIMVLNTRSMDFKEKKFVVNAQISNYQAITNEERIRFSLTAPYPLEDETDCWSSTLFRYEIKHKGRHILRYELVLTSENVVSPPSECLATISAYKENAAGTSQELIMAELFKHPVFELYAISKDITFTALDSDVGKFVYLYGEFYNDNSGTNEMIVSGKLFLRNASFLAWNQTRRTLNLADHMPEATCMDFLNALRQTFALEFFIDSERKEVVSKFLKDVLNDSPQVQLSKVIPDPEIMVEEEQGFEFSFSWDGADEYPQDPDNNSVYEDYGTFARFADLPWPTAENQTATILNTGEIYISYADEEAEGFLKWKIAGHIFKDLTLGNGSISVSPPAAPVLMGSESYKSSPWFACAKIAQPGFSMAFETGQQPCGLRFMLWHGLDPASGKTLASCTGIRGDGSMLTDFNLAWQGEKGLYETFWKRWAQWRMNMARQVSFKIALPGDDYYLIRRLGFDHPEEIAGNLYLLESIEFVLMIDRISQLVIKAWKV